MGATSSRSTQVPHAGPEVPGTAGIRPSLSIGEFAGSLENLPEHRPRQLARLRVLV